MNELNKATERSIAYLAREQRADGSFMCLVSPVLDDYRAAKKVPAIVPVNIVLSSLVHLEETPLIKKIKDRAADFLEGEKNAYWSFNYWFRNSDWYTKEPYPDDLDDTFCALAALYEYRPEIFDGEAMAKIVTMLTSAEKAEGGPYDMWLVPPSGRDVWNDTDLVVNSNIAFFLALQDISLPNLNAFIEKSIDEEDYDFPYNKIYPGIYFISRSYKGTKTPQVVKTLLAHQEADGKWENPLRTALAVSALINFSGGTHEKALQRGIAYLQKTQGKDGSWKPYSFYFQMKLPKKTLYAGSSSITTALAIEAMNKFKQCVMRPPAAPQPAAVKKNEGTSEQIYAAIKRSVKRRFAECDTDLRKEANAIIAKTFRGDTDREIALLPYFFRQSLGGGGEHISDDLVGALGAANVFGWMAYTIYDDFLDEEGSPSALAVANICLRESVEIFRIVLPSETGFAEFSQRIFDRIENANAWEVRNCRNIKHIPDYGDYVRLAERSLGHALTPVAILFALGQREHSASVKNVMQFFTHYIIARQLNDDAHDWEDDLSRGQINAAGSKLLRITRGKELNEEQLKKIFWEKVVVVICKEMVQHADRARGALMRTPEITDKTFFEKLLSKIERSGDEALGERAATMKFIRSYKGR